MNKDINLKIENRDTLHLKVSDALRKAILNGDFDPGERLIQEELAEALGVSRMPIREALRKLEQEGLVTLEPHRGAIVNPLNLNDIEEIYTLRSELEKLAIKRSVTLLKEEDILELEKLVKKMDLTEDPDEFVALNIDYHRLLMKGTNWKRLTSFIETLWNGFPQQTPHVLPNQMLLSKKEHAAILEAVKEKNSEKASELVASHIMRTCHALIKGVSQESSDFNLIKMDDNS